MKPGFDLIIFDCDGVLIDSELISATVIAENLTELGLPTTPAAAMHRFIGVSLREMRPMIEADLGRPLPAEWNAGLVTAIVAAMAQHAEPIAGAGEILEHLDAIGQHWRIASNSADAEMHAKFTRVGWLDRVAGRTFAAPRLFAAGGRPKPAPDVFLAAAASLPARPAACLVIEDSVPGVTGAVAAGMTCYGFAPTGDGVLLLQAGAERLVRSHDELRGLIAPPALTGAGAEAEIETETEAGAEAGAKP